MTYAFKISKSGFNVLTETDPDNLTFTSEYPTLKYATSGSVQISFSGNGSPVTTQITHSLGYRPFFLAYAKPNIGVYSGRTIPCPVFAQNTTPFGAAIAQVWVDTTKLYLTVMKPNTYTNNAGFSVTFDIHYRIFENNLGL